MIEVGVENSFIPFMVLVPSQLSKRPNTPGTVLTPQDPAPDLIILLTELLSGLMN